MKPPPHSLARLTNSGSSFRKQYSAMAGMLERSAMTMTPSGDMDPVEMLSGRTISTLPVRDSGRSGGTGGGLMFGPRRTWTFAASSGGGGKMSRESSVTGLGGWMAGGSIPRSRGSVISPLRAVARAVAGEARYTKSSSVPERPWKFLFMVRTDGWPDGGAWPMPTHGPQAPRRPAPPSSPSPPGPERRCRGSGASRSTAPTRPGRSTSPPGRWRRGPAEDPGSRSELQDHVADRGSLGHGQRLHPVAVEGKCLVDASLHRQPSKHLQDHVLGRNPRGKLVLEHHANHRGIGQLERMAGHGHSGVHPSDSQGEHPHGSGRRCVGVRPHERGPRNIEPLQVDVVGDPVTRPGEHGPVSGRAGLEEEVVVGILVIELDHVVVHVLHDQRDLDPVPPELLELHPRHGAGGVLQKDLVHPVGDGLCGRERPRDQMLAQDLLHDVLRHSKPSPLGYSGPC